MNPEFQLLNAEFLVDGELGFRGDLLICKLELVREDYKIRDWNEIEDDE